MEEDTCKKITNNIDKILRNNFVDEFDIIYSSGEVNKSPVINIGHKLALESWCVKYIYEYAYYKALHNRSTGGYGNFDDLIRWTQLCLLIMPEVSTFWNIRKKMIKKNQLAVNADLILSKLILTRKPKCNEAFQHRRWLYDCILSGINQNGTHKNEISYNNNIQTPEMLKEFLIRELQLCSLTASRKQNNYHAWNHRLWVLDKLSSTWNVSDIFNLEYNNSHCWISEHVSEHSGMHYHIKLLDKLALAFEKNIPNIEKLNVEFKNMENLYKKELDLNKGLMIFYPGHESLFYFRRVILLKLKMLLCNTGQRASSPPLSLKRSCIETLNAELNIILQEEHNIFQNNKCLSQYSDLIEHHLNWVDNVITH